MAYMTQQTDTGKNRKRRSITARAAKTTTPHLGLSRSPVSGTNLSKNREQTRKAIGQMGTAKATKFTRNLTDTQRAYISAAHKPNTRIGVKPIKPSKSKFVKKPL